MEKQLRYLAFQGGSRPGIDSFSQSLADLQTRANYIRHIQETGEYVDPVLRFHLGLDPVKRAEPKK